MSAPLPHDAFARAVRAAFGAAARVVGEEPLAGDASTRRYVRLRLAGGSAPPTAVVMVLPPDAHVSPEVGGGGGGERELSFVNVARYLGGSGLPVPTVYHDASAGPVGDAEAEGVRIEDARILVKVGDSITTDHISPAGAIRQDSPAGEYLLAHGVEQRDFNSYGARRGNHEVMMRGTFANVRLRNELAPDTEGWWTTFLPTGEVTSVYDAAMRYAQEGTSLGVLAGTEYGSGSSRDWAAKGPALLGVRFVLAESFERIHRQNLVGMGVLPLQFKAGDSAAGRGLTGGERYAVLGLEIGIAPGQDATIRVTRDDGSTDEFPVTVRVDHAAEVAIFGHGGILTMVLRGLLAGGDG